HQSEAPRVYLLSARNATDRRCVAHGVAPTTLPTGQLLPLDDTRRVRPGADRAGVARKRVTVRARAPGEAVPLHDALEAPPLRRARDRDPRADLELFDRERMSDLVILICADGEL